MKNYITYVYYCITALVAVLLCESIFEVKLENFQIFFYSLSLVSLIFSIQNSFYIKYFTLLFAYIGLKWEYLVFNNKEVNENEAVVIVLLALSFVEGVLYLKNFNKESK